MPSAETERDESAERPRSAERLPGKLCQGCDVWTDKPQRTLCPARFICHWNKNSISELQSSTLLGVKFTPSNLSRDLHLNLFKMGNEPNLFQK